ncbi:MAG: hypothetical protein ACYCX6_00020 [Vulcanimicrobiaceae bacterium]
MTVEEFIAAVAPIRRAKIFHAAQLRDFETYVERGYVVPRGELFERPPTDYTPFGSDVADVEGNHANDFFGNLLDQGYYSRDGRGIPNVYGSITLVFYPLALRNAGSDEIYVRRRAIWSRDPVAREILNAEQVRELYDDAGYARCGELQIVGGTLRLDDLAFVIVNPIAVRGRNLADRVRQLLGALPGRIGFPIQVYSRTFILDGRDVYDALVQWAGAVTEHRGNYDTLPGQLQARFDPLPDWKFPNLERFAEYLEHGTLSLLRGEEGHLVANVARAPEDEEPYYDDQEYFLEGITSLDADQLYERDELIWHVERAEFRLTQARLVVDEDERAAQIEAYWQEYIEAIEALNEWIEDTRRRILAGRDDMHERYLGSHDGQLSANLTGWADEFEPVDFSKLDAGAREHDLMDWRKVADYSETGW